MEQNSEVRISDVVFMSKHTQSFRKRYGPLSRRHLVTCPNCESDGKICGSCRCPLKDCWCDYPVAPIACPTCKGRGEIEE